MDKGVHLVRFDSMDILPHKIGAVQRIKAVLF